MTPQYDLGSGMLSVRVRHRRVYHQLGGAWTVGRHRSLLGPVSHPADWPVSRLPTLRPPSEIATRSISLARAPRS